MDNAELIDEYVRGPEQLRQAVTGLEAEQLDAAPVTGKWTTRQVVAHVADFEIVYAERMQRVIAEDRPTFFGGVPEVFAARLAYDQRDVDEELRMIESLRRHTARILGSLADDDFDREGIHSDDGPISLRVLLERITGHIPHHVKFIQEKRRALAST